MGQLISLGITENIEEVPEPVKDIGNIEGNTKWHKAIVAGNDAVTRSLFLRLTIIIKRH